VIQRCAKSNNDFDQKKIASRLAFKGQMMLGMWLRGEASPNLPMVVELANALEVGLEDILLGWLADHDPEHFTRYLILASQLMGRDAARDLLSGADENSDTPWWAADRTHHAALDVIVEMGEEQLPRGTFPKRIVAIWIVAADDD
jgi:transcriptional regulator with XRE-family HTH domain